MNDEIDPVDELAAVLAQTLTANGLRLTTNRGGYVGGGQPHPMLDSDPHAITDIAKGLLARKVAEPSRVPDVIDRLRSTGNRDETGLREAVLRAVEEVDNTWTDEGDHIEWDDERLPDCLVVLRRAYGAYLDAEHEAAALASSTTTPEADHADD